MASPPGGGWGTLCAQRPPAGPSSFPPAPQGLGAYAVPGFGVFGTRVPCTWTAALNSHALFCVVTDLLIYECPKVDIALSQKGHIDAVAHFKTKLNYKRAAAAYSSPVSDPRGLLSTSTRRKLHSGYGTE